MKIVTKEKRHMKENTKSGYFGVRPVGDRWGVSIRENGKSKKLGYFIDVVRAAVVFDEASRRIYGDEAPLNFEF